MNSQQIQEFKILLNKLSNSNAKISDIAKAFYLIEQLPNGIKLLNEQGFVTKQQILNENDSMNTAIIPSVVKKIKGDWFYNHTSVPVTPKDTRIVDIRIIKRLLS